MITGVGCHALLQGIFRIQSSIPCLLRLLHGQAGPSYAATLPLRLVFPSRYQALPYDCHPQHGGLGLHPLLSELQPDPAHLHVSGQAPLGHHLMPLLSGHACRFPGSIPGNVPSLVCVLARPLTEPFFRSPSQSPSLPKQNNWRKKPKW